MKREASKILRIASVLCFSILCTRLRAGDILLLNGNGNVANEVAISPQGSYTAYFPQVPAPRTVVTLEVKSRFDAVSLMGSNYLLSMTLNGHPVAAVKNRRIGRLINKNLISRVGSQLIAPWYMDGLGWRLLYAPDFTSAPAFYEGDPYTTLVDVTDLVSETGQNSLVLNNIGSASAATGGNGNVYVDKIAIHYEATGQSVTLLPDPVATNYINNGSPGQGPAPYSHTLYNGGGFSITVAGHVWSFTSAYSYPNAGFNLLTPGATVDASGQAGWTVQSGTATVTATAPSYTVQRSIQFTSRNVRIADTITNTSGVTMGMAVRNEVSLLGKENTPVRLAGCADATIAHYQDPPPNGTAVVNDYYSPGNPSLYIEGGDHGIGLLAEDSVYRNQARLYLHPGAKGSPMAGIKTEMLRLASGESYTLEWAVYPVLGCDYFDFVNLVRADWNVNTTVDGPWFWGYGPDMINSMSGSEVADLFKGNGIRYAVLGGGWQDPLDSATNPIRIGFGAGVFDGYWNSYRGRIAQSVDKIVANAPDCRVLLYYNSQRDTSVDIPSPCRFHDSWRTCSNGEQHYTDWDGEYSRSYSCVTINGPLYGDNSFGTEMKNVANRYMSELHADGLYWDEMENTGYGAPLLTFNRSDDHSCLLDPNYLTIKTDGIGLTQLLAEDHRLEVVDAIQNTVPYHGGESQILGNGPTCMPSLAATGIQRMVESQHNDFWPSEGHFQTPLGYLGAGHNFADMQRLFVFGLLPVGTSSSYTWDAQTSAIMPYLFPSTPIELHMGYLLAKERIVTTHPGNFGWPGDRSLVQVWYFDSSGVPVSTAYNTSISQQMAVTSVTLSTTTGPNQYNGAAVVLEKVPLTVTPTSGNAAAAHLNYTEAEVSLNFYAPGGAVLFLRNGRFPMIANASYEVDLGSTTRTIVADGNEADPVLTIPVPANTVPAIHISIKPI